MSVVIINTLIIVAVCIVFFAPTYVAFRRAHPNRWLIFLANITFGETGVGWLIALIWALRVAHLPGETAGSMGGQSGLNIFVNDHGTSHGAEREEKRAPASSAVSQIERLISLREKGHITVAEYEVMKAAVFARVG